MATAKKSRKTVKKSKKAPKLTAHQRLEQATTTEELLAGLPAANEEHHEQVQKLGRLIIGVIETGKFHPVVALDALQILLSAGIGSAMGDAHQKLFDGHIHRYHNESKLLSIMELFGGIEGAETAILGDEPATPESTPEGDFKG
jgi:hypothetical protein